MLPDDLRRRYLERLGLDAEPPSAEALVRLHRAHVVRVPYETLWIQAGEPRGIEPHSSVDAIARGRGGYCFQLNGAFAELLASLGYHVTRHVGGVHGPDGPSAAEMGNHLVLLVHGLPGSEPTWYVDVGLGDALYEPLPLRRHELRQGPFDLALDLDASGLGDWHLDHDPKGSFRGMAWRSDPVSIDAFAARHRELSTSPDSGFVRTLTVQRRDATGADVLRGLVLRRVGADASERALASRSEFEDALGDVFGIDRNSVDAPTWERTWARVHDAHVQWEEAGRP